LQKLESVLTLPTPVEPLVLDAAFKSGCKLFIKRDDLIHPHICGNKWRKLKYNITEALIIKATGLLTYGGAFSNHLVAVAASGSYLGMPTVGIIRSYNSDLDNATIDILNSHGMQLEFVHPDIYKVKGGHPDMTRLLSKYPHHYHIPEGGTNDHAIRGVMEMVEELNLDESKFTHIVVGLGTAGTLAGISHALSDYPDIQLLGISPFKGAVDDLEGFKYLSEPMKDRITILPHVPPTKFGAFSNQMVDYIKCFYNATGIKLDPVYNVKVMQTLETLLDRGYFKEGSKILVVHTGGLQGIPGYEQRYECDLV